MTAIRVELQLADGSFTTGMLRAGQSLEQFQRQLIATNPQLANVAANGGNVIRSMTHMDSSTKGFLATLRDVSIVAGIVSMGISKLTGVANGWVGEIVRINAEMEKLTYQMKAMSTASDPLKDAGDNVKYLREQATQMPFSLRTITNGFVKLKATGTDPMNGSLKAIADGIAAFGGSDESFSRTILGITQAAGKGVLQMEELRQQIGESMPIAMQLLARSMGMTVGQLAKEIQTGTVAARPALQMLYEELDRVYGGTAQRMMQTFSGQVTQLHTNLMNLATNQAGKGFFDQVKTQLRDINQFLAGDVAAKISTSLGNGLSAVVSGLRSTVEAVWEFRDELGRVAMIAATGVGLLALARGAATAATAIQSAGLAWSVFRVNMAEAISNIALGISGFKRLQTATLGVQYAAVGIGQALGAVLTGFASFAPLIVGVGVAAYTAGEYFGLFSDRVADAYEELKRFGAESKKQAEEVVANRRSQLEGRLTAMRNARTMSSPGAWDDKIAETEAELAALNKEGPQLITKAGQAENAKQLEIFKQELSEAVETRQRGYAQLQNEQDKAYETELAKAEENEQSKSAITEKYRKQLLENQKGLSRAIIGEYDTRLEALQSSLKAAQGDEKDFIQTQINYTRGLRNSEFQKLTLLDEKTFGAPKTSAGAGNEAKAVERAGNALERLKADIAGLTANINGASGAVAEMNEKIATGDYGTVREGGEAVAKLHQELLDAAEAKEALDKVMKGNQKADRDIAKIQQDLREKELELLEREQGEKLNDAQRMRLRLENNGYFALGPYDNIKKALGDVIGAMNAQGEAANQVGAVMRDNTFSNETIKHIDSVAEAIGRVTGQVSTLKGGLGDLNFGAFETGFGSLGQSLNGLTSSMPDWMRRMTAVAGQVVGGANLMSKDMARWGDPRQEGWAAQNLTTISSSSGMKAQVHKAAAAAFQGFIKELEASGYEIKSLGGHNVRNKRGGNSLSEHAFGNAIDINPGANPMGKNLVTDMPANISEMAAKYGLSWGGDWKSVKDAMHFEWRGSTSSSSQASVDLPKYQPTLLDAQIQKTKQLEQQLDEADQKYKDLGKRTNDADLADWIKQTSAQTKELGKDAEDTGKRYNQLVKAITSGKFGNSAEDKNPEADRYKEAIKAAKDFDAAAEVVAKNKKLRGQTDREADRLEQERLELNRRLAEAQKKVANPDYIKDTSALQELTTRLDEYIAKMKELYGSDSEQYRQALQTKSTMLQQQSQLDSATTQAKLEKERRDTENTLLTTTQMRQREMQQKLAYVDQALQAAIASGENEVEATKRAEAQKAAIRAAYAQEMSPMQKQFKEWGDLQGQLAQKSAQWMDSLAGGITDLIMGTGDLRSVVQGILKDIVNMGVKYLMSNMFQGKSSQANNIGGKKGGAAARGGKKGASIATGGKKGLFPTAHTGGIIGSTSLVPKMAHAAMFAGAPKFHTGGIIPGLLPSEVPIIAKRGEGVFTPEQMDAMGGFEHAQQFNVSSNITVNGSAGTPEQNTDLAKKMAREYETSVRSVVADELRKQTKVGNYMNQRSR